MKKIYIVLISLLLPLSALAQAIYSLPVITSSGQFVIPVFSTSTFTLNVVSSSSGSGASWGGITGTLSAQTDLQNFLNSLLSTTSASLLYIPETASTSLNYLKTESDPLFEAASTSLKYIPLSASTSLAYIPLSASTSLAYLPLSASSTLSYYIPMASSSLYFLNSASSSLANFYIPQASSTMYLSTTTASTTYAKLSGATFTGTVIYATTSAQKLCVWNGASYTILKFNSNSTSTSGFSTSSTCN